MDRQAGAAEASCGLLSVESGICGDTLRCSVVKRFGLGLVGVFLFAHLCLLLVIEDHRDTGPAHRTMRPCYDAKRSNAKRYDAMRCDVMMPASLSARALSRA